MKKVTIKETTKTYYVNDEKRDQAGRCTCCDSAKSISECCPDGCCDSDEEACINEACCCSTESAKTQVCC